MLKERIEELKKKNTTTPPHFSLLMSECSAFEFKYYDEQS